MTIDRTSEQIIKPLEAVKIMADFQQLLLENGMYPFIVFGTLLGTIFVTIAVTI